MKYSLILVLTLSVFAASCVKNAPKLDLSDNGVKNSLIGQLKENVYKKDWIEYNCADSGFYNSGINNNGFNSFNCAGVTKDSNEAVKIRNRVLDNGIGLIDSAYGVYIRNVREKRSVGAFLADLTEVGASTAIGITNGERAIQVIGVALTGFRAGRKSAQLNFFDDKTTSVLIKRMDASRSQVLGEIRQQQQRSTAQYFFDAGLTDLIRYFDVGTLNRAFTELDKQVSIEAEVARLGVLRIQNLSNISSIPTVPEAQVITDISAELGRLETSLGNKDNRDVAAARLKSIADKITAQAEFADIIKNLRDIAALKKADDTRTPTTKAVLKTAFDKIDKKEALSGEQYLTLINAVFGETEGKPGLQKLLKDIFNASK